MKIVSFALKNVVLLKQEINLQGNLQNIQMISTKVCNFN